MKINYRPEIDGLRAIAVVAVILYHSKITLFGYQPFKGGFIGVDIFFVISGYLITSIILKELVTTGNFSFKYFYERRIRRILPVLLFVMLASLPFAWKYLLPISFLDFSKSILYSLGFNSNFYFHFSNLQYGSEQGLLKPFLHTWSLSVEEQYYIFFPIIFLIAFKHFRKYLPHILILGLIISLGVADWGSRNHPSFNFYSLPTRGWELIAGSLLAYFEINQGKRSQNQILNQILPTLGLFLVVHSVIFFNDPIFHPSFYTLSPIVGVCLIVWFSHKDEVTTKILSSKLFVGIGLISYSLYIWHYPIFAFARVTEFAHGDILRKILLGIILFLLSIFSYFFIERPTRNKNNQFKFIFFTILIVIIFNILFNFTVIAKNGYLKKYPEIILNAFKNTDYRQNQQNTLGCHNRLGDKGFCIYNSLNNNVGDIILLGDSITDSILGNFIQRVKKTDFRLIHMSYGGNLYLPGFVKVNKKTKIIENDDYHKFREQFINNSSPNTYIVILGSYLYYFEKQLHMDEEENVFSHEAPHKYIDIDDINLNYDQRIEKLKFKFKNTLYELSKNKKVILLYPLPQSPKKILNKINNNYIKNLYDNDNYFYEDKVNYNKNLYLEFNKDIIKFFDQINSNNIYKIETKNIFCPDEKCLFYDDKFAYFFDEVHLTYKGSEILNDIIFNKINEIEKVGAISN